MNENGNITIPTPPNSISKFQRSEVVKTPENSDKLLQDGVSSNMSTFNDENPNSEFIDTIDEPIMDTLKRDVLSILHKIRYVTFPKTNTLDTASIRALKDWDLWGPLVFSLFLSCILGYNNDVTRRSFTFAIVFVLLCFGSLCVTINALLLGCTITFLQVVCLMGYCLFPLSLSSICQFFTYKQSIRFLVATVATYWSCRAVFCFLLPVVPPNRSLLVLYPTLLFYASCAFIIVLQ